MRDSLVRFRVCGIKWYVQILFFYDPVDDSTIVGTRVEFAGWCPSSVSLPLLLMVFVEQLPP